MIDLSSQPTDGESHVGEFQKPRHDAVPGSAGSTDPQPLLPRAHERAEASIQFISRWAGPAVLILTVVAIGWALIA